ncbi:MAG: D-sedoheptulose-7-phosphate isomerase, partial [Vicinamibacteria bacterium]
LALTTDTSTLTSIANDADFGEIFSRQIEALGRAGDAAIAISTSGRSPNILRAVEVARKIGLTTIGFTGGDGGKLAALVDHPLVVPSGVVARIQETHLALVHVICMLVDRILFSEGG